MSDQRKPTLQHAKTLVNSFSVPPFEPFISSNGHLQSIIANLYPPPPPVSYTRINLPTDDGLDKIAIDIAGGSTLEPDDRLPPKPIALLLHGLESNSTGVQSLRLADAMLSAGFKVLAPNYRSCAADAGPPVTLRLYHAGFTDDVTTILDALRAAAEKAGKHPAPVFLVGFSLGSNVMCNFLRQAGAEVSSKYNVVAAFGSCVPFDPENCQQTIDYGIKRHLYSGRLVKSMQDKFEAAVHAGVDVSAVSVDAVRSSIRIGDIDECYIAPVFGFQDRYDYYRKIDARHCLAHISVPTLVINSRNDPFFGHDNGIGLPTKEHIGNSPVRVLVMESGGHCGFLDYDGFAQKQPMYLARVCASFCMSVRDTLK